MVSEKLIIVLIIIAILLSVVSMVITISSVNTKMIPKTQLNEGKTEDKAQGQVGITISPWVAPNSSNVSNA
jgi:flagellar basal body-associated protein FliL